MMHAVRSLQVIASPRMGGAETSFQRIATALQHAGNPVMAAVRQGSELARLLDGELPLCSLPMRNFVDLASIRAIRQAALAHGAQVIQSWASRATWLTRAPPGVVHVARLGGYYKLRYFRHADGWIANTRGLRDWMVGKGFPPNRVEWINNFVPELPAGTVPSVSHESLGIPVEALLVVSMGRFIDKKGFPDLLAAFARLPARIRDRPVHLLLIGDGPMMAELRAGSSALEPRVHFTGWLEQPLPVIAMADLFVCPSRVEPLGNVVLEAWSQGVAVVCTETAGGTELIHSGDTGLLCPTQDVPRMAAAMQRVLGDASLRAALAGNGLHHYRHRYGERKTLESTLDFYRRLQGMTPATRLRH
ncbi:glycosyltransferase family 4 protein [Panacagrimonas sp.]|uniref:glycosyltransferase family 4 protein n=1 Tax=Panacagrimonas sp. TaxID=2480088 RepID=UPI003B52B60F